MSVSFNQIKFAIKPFAWRQPGTLNFKHGKSIFVGTGKQIACFSSFFWGLFGSPHIFPLCLFVCTRSIRLFGRFGLFALVAFHRVRFWQHMVSCFRTTRSAVCTQSYHDVLAPHADRCNEHMYQ